MKPTTAIRKPVFPYVRRALSSTPVTINGRVGYVMEWRFSKVVIWFEDGGQGTAPATEVMEAIYA